MGTGPIIGNVSFPLNQVYDTEGKGQDPSTFPSASAEARWLFWCPHLAPSLFFCLSLPHSMHSGHSLVVLTAPTLLLEIEQMALSN